MTIKDTLDRLEDHYQFECHGGQLRNCVEWQQLKADCSAVVQERDALARRVAWQPRETAPDDGSVFLAFSADFIDADFNPNGIVEACYDGEEFIGAVWDGQHDIWRTQRIEFTHWVRQPAPPAQEGR